MTISIQNRDTVRVFVNQQSGVITRSIFDLADVDLTGISNNSILTFNSDSGNVIASDTIDGGSF